MTKLLPVTLADVARAAGLSKGGASYALRGHPTIPLRTVERVRRIATALGYRPDARVNALMATIRRRQPIRRGEPLAFVWLETPREAVATLPFQLQYYVRVIFEHARVRAEQLGCTLVQFWLDDSGPRAAGRLQRILRARGISGVILTPAACEHRIALDFGWEHFASIIIGGTEMAPPLHRSMHHHFQGVCTVLRQLAARGRRRPAAILDRRIHERINGTQLAAFVANHPAGAEALDYVRFGDPETAPVDWLAELQPDALVVNWQTGMEACAALRRWLPDAASPVICLDWHPHGVLPGVEPDFRGIAANAVDLLLAQMNSNERGVPERPTTVMAEGLWREGPEPACCLARPCEQANGSNGGH